LADASFAGLLASMAAQHSDTPWNDDQLAQDVATIGYEKALGTHTQMRPGSSDAVGDAPAASESQRDSATAARPLKTATITVRLSESECAQLRRRAAEAGMTISAYLRSCTLEVESLRAQVKEALASLRSSAAEQANLGRNEDQTRGFARFVAAATHLLRKLRPGRQPGLRLNPANPFAPVR
jgi:hypothetical protein